MHRREFTTLTLALATLPAWALDGSAATQGVREALALGAEAAVAQLGRPDGFLGNPKVRIGLPGQLEQAAKLLKFTGQQRQVDDLVTTMNRAAERVVPEAKPLLLAAVKSLTVQDAVGIVQGGDTSVTDFFADRTRTPLTERLLPLVQAATSQLALAAKYDAVAGKAQGLGLVKADDASIDRYVTRKALDGLYLVIGEEERQIRADPLGSGSAILKQVFGR